LRYLDAFGEGGYLGPFVERTWGLLTKLGAGVKYDTVSLSSCRCSALREADPRVCATARRQSYQLPRSRSQDAQSTLPVRVAADPRGLLREDRLAQHDPTDVRGGAVRR
jgi:hypothetical protein